MKQPLQLLAALVGWLLALPQPTQPAEAASA
eukprot:SAG22_NODE_13073_length_420_cov_0.529595_1_plen_30_part_01